MRVQVLMMAAALVVACGGDDGETSGTGGAGGTTATGPASSSSSSGAGGNTTTSGSGGCTPAPTPCFDYCEFSPMNNVSFVDDIIPIFEASCNSNNCHGDINNPDAGLYLGEGSNTDPDQILEVYGDLSEDSEDAPTMRRVDPFDPERSWLMIKLDGDMSCPQSECSGNCGQRMPRGTGAMPLPPATLDLVRSWIAIGAPGP